MNRKDFLTNQDVIEIIPQAGDRLEVISQDELQAEANSINASYGISNSISVSGIAMPFSFVTGNSNYATWAPARDERQERIDQLTSDAALQRERIESLNAQLDTMRTTLTMMQQMQNGAQSESQNILSESRSSGF
jgi:hypothetical protein